MLELILAREPRLPDALSNLMHRQTLRNRNRDDYEIAIDQMPHHVRNPLPALERIIAWLNLTSGQTNPPIKPQRQPAPHHAGIFQIARDLPKRLPLLNRNFPSRRKLFGRTKPKVRDRPIPSRDRDDRNQSHHSRK